MTHPTGLFTRPLKLIHLVYQFNNIGKWMVHMSESKKRKSYKAKMRRINISINDGLLDMVDQAAEKDFTTRSDVIRSALLWYLRPQGRDLNQADPAMVLKTLQHRKTSAGLKKMIQDLE